MKIKALHIITVTAILCLALTAMANPKRSKETARQLQTMTDDQLRLAGNHTLMENSDADKALFYYNTNPLAELL